MERAGTTIITPFPPRRATDFAPGKFDLSYGFIRLLKSVGLAWDVRIPPAEKLKFESRRAA